MFILSCRQLFGSSRLLGGGRKKHSVGIPYFMYPNYTTNLMGTRAFYSFLSRRMSCKDGRYSPYITYCK